MTKDRFLWITQGIDYDLLNDWEQKFVESIELQFHEKGYLSEKQESLLEDIFKEKSR